MTEQEILLGLLQTLQNGLHRQLEGLSLETLSWKPDPGANSIAVTAWHIGRLLDSLKVRSLENRPMDDQVWLAGGWSTRTGYDPRGIGSRGTGALMGYTQQEVDQVPVLPADQLLAYIDQVSDALSATIGDLSPEALHQPAPGALSDESTSSQVIRHLLIDGFQHLGEIRAYKAMRERLAETG